MRQDDRRPSVLRLIPATSGQVLFEGRDVFSYKAPNSSPAHDMQIVFQDPYSSLDPRMPIGESMAEG